MKVFTFEKWVLGNYDYPNNPFLEEDLSPDDQTKENSERKRIEEAQKKVYEWALDHNLKIWQTQFNRRLSEIDPDSRDEFIKTELIICDRNLKSNLYQYQAILSKEKDYNWVTGRVYGEYKNRNKNYNERAFPISNIGEKHVLFKYMKWVEEQLKITPRNYTLKDFFKGDKEQYQKYMDILTRIKIPTESANYFVKKESGKYYMNQRTIKGKLPKGNLQYLGAFIYLLIEKELIDFGAPNKTIVQNDLCAILENTFNFEFKKTITNQILYRHYFDEKYKKPFKTEIQRIFASAGHNQ